MQDKMALARILVIDAENLGRLMSAEMAEKASELLNRKGDVHGSEVLAEFASLLRDNSDQQPTH